MIVVVGRVQTDADRRADLIAAAQAVAAASREEAGCVNYGLYEDTERSNHFVVVEEWESSDALKQHFATEHVDAFMRAITPTLVAPPDVKFHTIASTMDLADVSTQAN